jgi:hypothetical protein
MGHCVRMILPRHETNENERNRIIAAIVKRHGGVTTWDGEGWWDSPKAGLVLEPIQITECSLPEWDQSASTWWSELTERARCELEQERIFYTVRPESILTPEGTIT